MGREWGPPVDAEVPAELRQERIADLVADSGFERVAELATRFQVSTVTIRSDLQALERRGRLRRIRGGAVPASVVPGEQPFEASELTSAREKAHIGLHGARMVASGETVLLDVGSTTTAVARALIAREELTDVTVFTPALNVALELEAAYPRVTVIVTGGTVRPLQHSLVNPLATVLLERLRASIAFIGCNGVDVHGGITNINLPEAEVKRAMLLAARRRVIVADGSKLGEIELAQVCALNEVSTVVTDETADPAVVSEIEAAGVSVEIAR
ncbi:MAG TPA: DeoR/GlpR family DNA-binding transcription regulator [Solirubrobacteraceae bacterium]|nr:DeoR/GlpR family DNA-binding transcription regulator [Solirubrobacteraceae bacterium]